MSRKWHPSLTKRTIASSSRFSYKQFSDFFLFSSRSVRSDLESQLTNEFPFLPSYEMAMNEVHESQQNINRNPERLAIDNGVILEIGNTRDPPSTESQSYIIEVNDSASTPRNYSLDDEDVSEIRNSNVNPVVQDTHGSVEERVEANMTSSSGNCTDRNNEVDLSIGPSSVLTSWEAWRLMFPCVFIYFLKQVYKWNLRKETVMKLWKNLCKIGCLFSWKKRIDKNWFNRSCNINCYKAGVFPATERPFIC